MRDGLGEQARLGGERLHRDPHLAERALGEPRARAEPLGQAGVSGMEELRRPLARTRQGRCEREPSEVERGGERDHLEVPDREDDTRLDDHERVRLRGVELDRELPGHEPERIARGTVHLGASGSRGDPGAPAAPPPSRRGALRAAGACANPRRAHVPDREVDQREVGAERLEVEGAGDIERIQQPERVVYRECRPAGGERALVEQGDRSPWTSSRSPSSPSARSAIAARSLWPMEPRTRTWAARPQSSASTSSSATTVRRPSYPARACSRAGALARGRHRAGPRARGRSGAGAGRAGRDPAHRSRSPGGSRARS